MAQLSEAVTSLLISMVCFRFFLALVKNRPIVGVGFGPGHLRYVGVVLCPRLFVSIGLGRKAESSNIISPFRLFQVLSHFMICRKQSTKISFSIFGLLSIFTVAMNGLCLGIASQQTICTEYIQSDCINSSMPIGRVLFSRDLLCFILESLLQGCAANPNDTCLNDFLGKT